MLHSKQDVDRHVNEVFRNIKSEYQRNIKCYQIAKLYYKFKDYKSAIKYINRYISTTNSPTAHRLLGECYLGINLKVKALDSFKASLMLNGCQQDLVLKICSLLMDPEVSSVTPRATYWLERAESMCPSNPIVFQLREHLLKSNIEGKQDNGQLEKLILSEISARPADVTVRIRLLNFFIDTKRYKIAYQHALEIEERNSFSNDHRWYDCLCNLMQAYEKASNDPGYSFYIKKILFLERRAELFLQEFQEEVKTIPECSSALFALDQALHSVSKIEVPQEEKQFFSEFMRHMNAQHSFHLATLALKRAKREYGIWPKAFRTASPLLLQATQNTMDVEDPWYNTWVGRNKMEREVKQWNKSATSRISQAGHVLLAWSQNKGPKFLEKVSQFCGGKWQSNVYQDIFYNRDHQQATGTSHFINDSFFTNVPTRLLSESELSHVDKVSQLAHPDSLHHLVWLGLAYCNANGQLSHDFRCTVVPDLQFSVENLTQYGPETLNQLDVDAFLYASVICAKSATPSIVSTDRPSRLPISISEELCSVAQADWWSAVYKTYTNQATGNISDMRLKLRRGIETIRASGQHGLHVKVIVMLAKLFQERAAKNKNPNELSGLEERAHLYWTAAIPVLEKMEKNQQLREVPNRLFDYRGKDLTPSEVKGHLEDGRLFLACRLMKQGRDEQAIEAFQSLKSPYATFYQALIYEKLASEEINHRPEHLTSENRSQHIILLTRARDAFYLTLDRLRCPSVDPNHPLNGRLQDHLEKVEKQLAMIDPDSTLNRNGDSQSDETDTAPGPLSPDVEENLESSFNVYNTSNFVNAKNHSTSRVMRQNFSDKPHGPRFEARPSPERLDAQLRHLVQTNNNGLQAIVDQLKEMKSSMQIELKDLGCVTRDLLAEMKRWNDRLESFSKRGADVIKPEDLFEEDYEDFTQLSQPYAPYQNYPRSRPITGTQGTSTVTYGTPVPSPVPPLPSPVPPVQPVLPTPENPLIPPSFYPGTHAVAAGAPVIPTPENSLIPPSFYPGAHPIAPIDPSLLLCHNMDYYAPGVPYSENQNVSDHRGGTGIQKGAPFAKNPLKAPEPTPVTSIGLTAKPQPPNVVITSSDTLPAFTSAGTPPMSVTVPPQHIRGLTVRGMIQSKHCETCKARVEGNAEKCAACESKEEANEKTNLGGFAFSSPPILKPPVLKLNEQKEKPKEAPKPSPFAEFSFSAAAATTTTKTKTTATTVATATATATTTTTTIPSKSTGSLTTVLGGQTSAGAASPESLFANVKPDPNAFKKDANFSFNKGKDSLLFGHLNKPKDSAAPKGDKDDDDEDGDKDFEPTAEFTPVVDLPELVDVKTGEENDKVLFNERAKLLRFDTTLKEWKERGVGQMKILLNEETGKVRLIMRRELVLKVCCNHYLSEDLEFKRMTKSEKALTWCAQDYSEGDLKPELLALRFSSPATMMAFEKVVQDTQSKMKNGRLEGTVVKDAPEKSKDLKPLSELFKPKAGSWECGTCLIRNNQGATKCASCETPKPGSEAAAGVPSTESKGLGKGITLPPSQFKFGFPPGTATATSASSPSKFSATPSTGLTFGRQAPSNESTGLGKGITLPPSQFKFGYTPAAAPVSSSTSKITFTSPEATGLGKGTSFANAQFTYGTPATTTATTTTTAASSSSSSFVFKPETTGFTFTQPGTTSACVFSPTTKLTSGKTTTASPNQFVSFTPGTAVTSASTPSFTFRAPKLSVTASNTFPASTPSINLNFTTKTPTSLPQFSAPTITTSATKSEDKGFTFKLTKEEDKGKPTLPKSEGNEKFEFRMSNTTPSATKASPAAQEKSSGDGAHSDNSDEEPEEDDGDHIIVKPIVPLPEKVEAHTGEEEEDVLYERRAKLFRFTDREWKERGIGDVKILRHKTTKKIRLLMRREVILKVCLNHYLTPDIEFVPKDEKTWNWTAADFSDGEVKNHVFAIRFKTPEVAQEFKKALDDVLDKAAPSPPKTGLEEKANDVTEAMKNFTFAVPAAPKSEPLKGPQSSDDDILVVYENKVTPEQREKAIRLRLPPNFYAYLQAPDCPGCCGCDTDDGSAQSPQSGPADSTTASSVTNFQNSPWGALNFGKENFDGKVLFAFAGNQAPTKRKRTPEAPKVTADADEEKENEDEDEDDEEDEYEGEVDDVEDSEYEENLEEEEEKSEDYEDGDDNDDEYDE